MRLGCLSSHTWSCRAQASSSALTFHDCCPSPGDGDGGACACARAYSSAGEGDRDREREREGGREPEGERNGECDLERERERDCEREGDPFLPLPPRPAGERERRRWERWLPSSCRASAAHSRDRFCSDTRLGGGSKTAVCGCRAAAATAEGPDADQPVVSC